MHSHDKLAILIAMAKIPGLAALEIPIEDIASDGELACLEASMNAAFDAALAVDIEALPAPTAPPNTPPTPARVPSAAKSQRTTIRIPGPVLVKFQSRAQATGTRYQTLIIKTLKAAANDW